MTELGPDSDLTWMEALDAEQRRLVAAYWWQRAEGELTSWVGFQHVLDDLRLEGAVPAVIQLAERAVNDEYRHATWCRQWALAFGHRPAGTLTPRTERPVTFVGATAAENRLLRIALCCFTESFGCCLLKEVRPRIVQPALRRLNQRHFADELQHSRVGWGHLAGLDATQRRTLEAWLPRLLDVLPQACAEGAELDREDLVPYGYFTPELLRMTHQSALDHVILPGLRHLGLRGAA